MRLPAWIEQVDRGVLSEDGRFIVVTFRVKSGHPWRLTVRRLAESISRRKDIPQ